MSTHPDHQRRTRRPTLSGIGSVLLSFTAILGTLCIVATVAAVVFDVKPLVFRSGSMSPQIETGALALARTTDASEVKVGDVVSVKSPTGERITHRVMTATLRGDTATLVLKGDANATPDSEPYITSSVERVFFDVPRLGYVVSWTTGPAGVFVGGLIVGGAVLMLGSSLMRRDAGGARRASAIMIVLALGAGASTIVGPQRTLAAFTDDAAVKSRVISSFKVPTPVIASCNDSGTNVVITFPAVASTYPVTYTARIVGSNTTYPVTTSGTNRVVTIAPPGLSLTLGSTVTLRINAVLASAPTWISGDADRNLRIGLLGGSVNCA